MARRGVTVDFNADTARFDKGVKKASAGLGRFQNKATNVGASITKTFALLGGIAAIGGLFRFTKGIIDAQDALSKLSQKVGLAVEDLVGLQHAAGLAGVSSQGLTKGLKTLSAQIFDASKELLESTQNFAALNIEFQNADKSARPLRDVFLDMADRFSGMEDSGTKAALAVKLLGKEGLNLIPFLNQGTEAIEEMIEEGKLLNDVTAAAARQSELFNDSMARLGKVVKSVAIVFVNDLIPFLSQTAQLFSDEALAGKVKDASEEVREADKEFNKLAFTLKGLLIVGSNVSAFFEGLGLVIGASVAQIVSFAKADFEQIGIIGDLLDKDLEKLFNDQVKRQEQFLALGSKEAPKGRDTEGLTTPTIPIDIADRAAAAKLATAENFVLALEKEAAAIGKTTFAIKRMSVAAQELSDAQRDRSEVAIKLLEVEDALTRSDTVKQVLLDKRTAQINEFINTASAEKLAADERLERLQFELSLMSETGVERDHLLAQFDIEEAARKKLLEVQNSSISATEKAIIVREIEAAKLSELAVEGFAVQVAAQQEQAENMTRIWDNFVVNFQRTVADEIFQVMDANFDKIGQSFLRLLKRMLADAFAANLAQALFGNAQQGTSGFLGTLLGAVVSGVVGAFTGGGSFPNSGISSGSGPLQIPFGAKGLVYQGNNLIPLAKGGIIDSPTLLGGGGFLGGESGPEAVIPLSRDSQGNLGIKSEGGSRGGDHIEVNISTGVAQTVRVEIANAIPEIIKQTTEAVVAAKNRQSRLGSQLG